MTTNKRQALRLEPSQGHPIKVAFKQKDLQKLSSQIKVLDISVGGIRLQIPDAESIVKPGMSIRNMEVSIPDEGVCVLTGSITFIKGEQCGIEFLRSGDHELNKIARYIFNRERSMRT